MASLLDLGKKLQQHFLLQPQRLVSPIPLGQQLGNVPLFNDRGQLYRPGAPKEAIYPGGFTNRTDQELQRKFRIFHMQIPPLRIPLPVNDPVMNGVMYVNPALGRII